MRIQVYKDDQQQLVKEDRLQRFLDQGWRVQAEPDTKKTSRKPRVEAQAEIVQSIEMDVIDVIDVLDETPTETNKGD